jgi:hypothetical protein
MNQLYNYSFLDRMIESAMKNSIEQIKIPSDEKILASWEKVKVLLEKHS